MRKRFVFLILSGCLIFFPAFVVLADNPETFESITEYGETGNEQDNLSDSQDGFENSHVDDEVLQDIADTSLTDVSDTDEASETLEETSPDPEEPSSDVPEESPSEALKDEESLPDEIVSSTDADAPETVPESDEHPDTESESLAQYYKEYRESLDRLLEYRMEEDSREAGEDSSSAPDENLTGATEDLESLVLFLIFASGIAGGLSASRIMWGRVR